VGSGEEWTKGKIHGLRLRQFNKKPKETTTTIITMEHAKQATHNITFFSLPDSQPVLEQRLWNTELVDFAIFTEVPQKDPTSGKVQTPRKRGDS